MKRNLIVLLILFAACKKDASKSPVNNSGTGGSDSVVTELSSVDKIHNRIWKYYVDKNDLLLTYTGKNGEVVWPTNEECEDGKPNAWGWWTPIENGCMFGGLYLDGLIKRYAYTKKPEDAALCKRIANGLVYLYKIGKADGFIARGVTEDGVTHYKLNSNDQTGGWVYGLWRYLQTNIPSADERADIESKLVHEIEVCKSLRWNVPSESPFGPTGNMAMFNVLNAPRVLLLTRIAYLITKDTAWQNLYVHLANEKSGGISRLEMCRQGMDNKDNRNAWVESIGMASLRALHDAETDPEYRKAYFSGLQISAKKAMASLDWAYKLDPTDTASFNIDWRPLNALWQPQTTAVFSYSLGVTQLADLKKREPRRQIEESYVREPAFAAWIVTLGPDQAELKKRVPAIQQVINHYNVDNLYNIWYFPLEAAWYRTQGLK